MKKNILLLASIILTLSFTSCESWLDVSPKADVKAETFFEHESNYKDGLIGIYTLMSTNNSYGRDLTYTYVDVLAQYYDNLDGIYDYGSFIRAYKYEWESASEESRLNTIWSMAYKGVVNANIGIENIDKNKDKFSNEAIYSVFKGEYLALRAYLQFDMLRLFAPSPAKGLDQKAIPYVDKYTSLAFPQLSIKEVVERVEKDLLDAKELMREYDPYGPNANKISNTYPELFGRRHYRMNYYAVTALLARVYNYVGYKDKALEQAEELTGKADGSTSIPSRFSMAIRAANAFDKLFDQELIFSINKEDLQDVIKTYFFNEKNDYYGKHVLSMTTQRKNSIFGTGDLSASYRSAWMEVTSKGSTYALSKYRDLADVPRVKKVPMLRLSEMFLIAAECSENEGAALYYLNTLRKHRGLTLIPDASNLKEEIYKEYRREFIGEGQLFYYYKRNLSTQIGSADDVTVDVDKAYKIPLPKNEIEFGNY